MAAFETHLKQGSLKKFSKAASAGAIKADTGSCLRSGMKRYMESIYTEAVAYTDKAKRKRISTSDVELALQTVGRTLT